MNSEHDDFQGRSKAVFVVSIIMLALSTIFVSLRMLSRGAILKRVGIDDYFICLAWIIGFGLTFSICYACAYGLGRHEGNIPFAWREELRKLDYVFTVLYQPALMATKTSILSFYLTLPTSNKAFKWASIGTLFVVNAGGFALCIFTIFQCEPVDAAWAVPLPASASCHDIITIYLSSAPLNILTDLAILFLPMPILTSMRLPRKQKIILLVTFGVGAFVAAVDVVRIAYLQSASNTRLHQISNGVDNQQGTNWRTDFSWYASFSFMWSVIEVNVGIVCACVPGLKPLASRFIPNMLRDAGDPPTRNNSVITPVSNETAKMREAHRVPSLPSIPSNELDPECEQGEQDDDHVLRRDFSDPPQSRQHSAAERPRQDSTMGMMEFLTDPEMNEKAENPGEMDMMDFLTTPDMNELPEAYRTQTGVTNSSRDTAPNGAPAFFDFVDMHGRKCLIRLNFRESAFPIAMVSVLFFIWGFEYGLLDVLNQQFQRVAHMSAGQATAIHSAYFAGYLFGPTTVGYLALKHWGFKACFSIGLAIYGCGTLIFWPAAVLTSFPAFVITNFLVAFGLSLLEVAANPFIALCGPQQFSEIRLNFAQGIQAIGTVVAPLIADKAFIHRNIHRQASSLVSTQWAYLGISLFTILLAVGFYYVPLPEVSDEELQNLAERSNRDADDARIGSFGVIWITLALGVFSQFCYVGGQEVNGTLFSDYFHLAAPRLDVANYSAIAHTAFAVSRFVAAGLGFWIKPRILMLFFYIGSILFAALAMNYTGNTGVSMMIITFFFEGPLFSLIFAQALRGMGRHTKMAAVSITAAVSGGAVFSPISSAIISDTSRTAIYAVVVSVAAFAAGTLFPIWLNVSPLARRQVDPNKDGAAGGSGGGDESPESRSSSSASRRASKSKLPFWKEKKRKSGIEGRGNSTEWKEESSGNPMKAEA